MNHKPMNLSLSETESQSLLHDNMPLFVPHIPLQEYTYHLPQERIAQFPLAERDASKLLIASAQEQTVRHSTFRALTDELPASALLVLNNSKVISARIYCQKETGGAAEILCLSPITPSLDPVLALQSTGTCRWHCMIGGRNIRTGNTLILHTQNGAHTENAAHTTLSLTAYIIEKNGTDAIVEFSWQPAEITFAELLEELGRIPLPPYMNREATDDDVERYQTVYAFLSGSVAAPTAGLHYTERVFQDLRAKGIREEFVTLHVGAGTFKPMQGDSAHEHTMHIERMSISRAMLATLTDQVCKREQALRNGATSVEYPVVSVGTTSLRTLESLYVFGANLYMQADRRGQSDELFVGQWDAFALHHTMQAPPVDIALETLCAWMDTQGMTTLQGETQLMIVPGFPFQICDALTTNFHQPQSSLMLLVAAFVGTPFWQRIYEEALAHQYRFLSYGDTSLLFRRNVRFQ
jgi:S-adenosylmethionine:tRNA ribosyltransferase-isomerase